MAVSPLLRADGTFVLTTSVGFPQKAFNIRRAHLSLLARPVVDWYFMRLVVTITPTRVISRPAIMENLPIPVPRYRDRPC